MSDEELEGNIMASYSEGSSFNLDPICIFIYILFNDTFSSSDCIASNDRIIDE
jgi:hypothetical protein